MELIKDVKKLGAAITSIANRGAKLDESIQVAAVSVIAHVEACGDVTLADRLVNAMPKGARKLALVEFMLAYGKLSIKPLKQADKDAGRVFSFDKEKSTDIDSAMAKPWHEFRKEKAVADAFDVQAQVKALIGRLQAAATSGKTIAHKKEAIAEVKALLSALEQGA